MTTQPIRHLNDIKRLKKYFLERGEYRNYLLITIGVNSALRISDILSLKWSEIYCFESKTLHKYIIVTEQKTGKVNKIYINAQIKQALQLFIKNKGITGEYVFCGKSGKLSRSQAHRIIKQAGRALNFPEEISCHTLRKTFGYHAWKNGVQPAMLMELYNHSSYEVTKRYLGINQDEKDGVYRKILL